MIISYGVLLQFEKTIYEQQGSYQGWCNAAKSKQFIKNAGMRLQTIHKKRQEILEEFLVTEEVSDHRGGVFKQPKFGEDNKPILLEGKTIEEFESKMNELLQTQIEIKQL